MRRRTNLWLIGIVALAGVVQGAVIAPSARAVPVIPPGQEERVLALLEPHGFGAEANSGWQLHDVGIEARLIRIAIASGGRQAVLVLHHPAAFESTEQTSSFSLERIASSESDRAALDPWVDALRQNDDGEFWGHLPAEPGSHREQIRAPQVPVDGVAIALTLVALLLVFALGVWENRRLDPCGVGSEPDRFASRGRAALLALGVTVVAALLLWFTAPAPPLHPDTVRDLLLARDCLESGLCRGPTTSLRGIEQHAGWTRLLAVCRSAELAPHEVHRLLIGANALAAGLLGMLALRRLPIGLALGASATGFLWLVWAAGFPTLWNPTLSPLAYALLFVGLLQRRWWAAGMLAGVGVVLAIETHVAGIVSMAVAVLGLRSLADRPGRAVALALALVVGVEAALSMPAILGNFATPWARRAGPPLLILGLGVAWFVGGWLRRRHEGGPRVFSTLAVCAFGTTVPPLLAALAAGHFLSARYFSAAIVPAVGVAAATLMWKGPGRRLTRWAITCAGFGALAILPASWTASGARHLYDFQEVGVLADELGVGDDYASVRMALRGPAANLLGEGLAVWARDPSFALPAEPAPTTAPMLTIVRVESLSEVPRDWRAVSLPSGSVVAIGEGQSWLRPRQAEVCLSCAGTSDCVQLSPAHWQTFGGDRTTYERLASGALPAAEMLRERVQRANPESSESLTLYVHVPIIVEGASSRALQFFDALSGSGGWRIARVEGVRFRGELGGRRIELLGPGEGTLTLEHTQRVDGYVPTLVLEALELTPSQAQLRERACADFLGCGPAEATSEH